MPPAGAAESAKFTQAGYRRPLHWVLKIGSLEKSLDFFEKVFGMKVHRHEEFASGCEATCNGPYGGAWSKTMIGYQKEDTTFALELTYNYGIAEYPAGNDLRFIALRKSVLKADPAQAGYPVETDALSGNEIVTGPDGYKFMLVDTEDSPDDADIEPFLFVSIHVLDLAKAVAFHTEVLGAEVYSSNTRGHVPREAAAVVGFSDTGVRLELVQLPDGTTAVDHASAAGRFATETEDGAPEFVGKKVKEAGGIILHGPIKLQPHNEEVVIVQDVDGYEYCFVDARGFTNCVNVAYQQGGTAVDWTFRNRLLQASLAADSPKLQVAKVLAGNYDKAAVQAHIDKTVAQGVVILGETTCSYCSKAQTLLSSLGAPYQVVDLDKRADGNAWRVELAARTSCPTLPQIFIGGQFVGGFTDGIEKLHQTGELEKLLRRA